MSIVQETCRKQQTGALHERRQQQVKCIERVQNPMLWRRFALRRGELSDKHGAQHEMDTTLFHGTDKSICEAVVNEGFDIRVAKPGALGTGKLLSVFAGFWNLVLACVQTFGCTHGQKSPRQSCSS